MSEKKVVVSVIIPFYNNVEWLCEAVESVLLQRFDDYEIIVVNDGSYEDVSSFLNRYESRIKYYYKQNGGAASARNFGIKKATGKYVAFLDSDDLWNSNKLLLQVSKMESLNAVWSYSDYKTFGENIKGTEKKMLDGPEGIYMKVSPYIATPSVTILRDILVDNNYYFCEDLKYGEDHVLWNRLSDNYPILYIPDALVNVRMRGTNASRRAAAQMIGRVKVYKKSIELIPNYKNKKSFVFRTAILFCRFGCLFVNEKNEKKRLIELLSKVLYLFPYMLFKIDRIFERI